MYAEFISLRVDFLLVAADGEEVLGDVRGGEVGVLFGQLVFMGEVVLRS